MINSVSIQLGEGAHCVQVLLPPHGAVYFHGDLDAVRKFANDLLAAVAVKESQPAPEPLPEVAKEVTDVDVGESVSESVSRYDTYRVSVKTSHHVEVKRSWVYEIEASTPQKASHDAARMASRWWGLEPRDITVISVEKC